MSKFSAFEESIFVFPTERQAQYWFDQTLDVFHDDVTNVYRQHRQICFPEGSFWFMSEHAASIHKVRGNLYPPEALYIILNDFERTWLETYEGEKEGVRC